MNSKKIAISALTGMAAGALLGVLFAPHKGTKTRKKLRKNGKKLLKSGSDGVDDAKRKIDDLLGDLTHKFEAAKKDVTEMWHEKKKAAESNSISG